MTRAYTAEPVDSVVVDEILDLARRGPSAGKTDSLQFLVLDGADVARYWDTTLPVGTRPSFPWPQLLDAPVLVIPWVEPGAYVRRYSEADKVRTGLGEGPDAWSVPYWWVDGGAAAMTILFAAADAGLGALLFGLFEHEDDVRREFGVPDGFRAIGTSPWSPCSGSAVDVSRLEAAAVRHSRAPRGLGSAHRQELPLGFRPTGGDSRRSPRRLSAYRCPAYLKAKACTPWRPVL